MQHQFTQEDTEEHVRGLVRAADLIEENISTGDRSKEMVTTYIDALVRHIEYMCAMPHIINCGVELDPFLQAAARGREWLDQA